MARFSLRPLSVPRFLLMPSVGLDISDETLRFVELLDVKGGKTLGRFGEMRIPKDVIVGGRIKKPDELRKLLKTFCEENKLSFVRVSLPEEMAYLVKMETVMLEGSELRQSIAAQLEEYVPISASESIFDYQVVRETEGRKGYGDVVVAVVPRKEIDLYTSVFGGTGMIPFSFEIEAQAIARALIPRGDKGSYMIVDFGKVRTGVSIVSLGAVRFTSTIAIGSDMITEAIVKSFNVSAPEAEKMKNTRMLGRNPEDEEFNATVMSTVSILRDEINKLFIYWHTEGKTGVKEKRVEKIILSGGGSNLKGLTEYLSGSLRVPVVVGNPWINVNTFDRYIPELPKNRALGATTAIGLALEQL